MRDWAILAVSCVVLLIGAGMVWQHPPGVSLGLVSHLAGPTKSNPLAPALAQAAQGPPPVPLAAPYYQWDYVWGLSHPAIGAPAMHAGSVLMVDLDTRHVLYANSPRKRMAQASTAKLMTAMVAFDNAGPDTVLAVPAAAGQMEPDLMGLTAGEKVSVGDLMYGLLLDSGNDAAETLADATLGHDRFVRAMNDKAARLGLQDTHFVNPSGLDEDNQYSSAQDLAITAGYLYQHYPPLAQVVATKTYAVAGTSDHKAFYPENFNKLLWSYPGAIGFKTGLTDNAGTCLVAGAHRGSHTLLVVELNDPVIFTDATALLDYGFRRAD